MPMIPRVTAAQAFLDQAEAATRNGDDAHDEAGVLLNACRILTRLARQKNDEAKGHYDASRRLAEKARRVMG